MKKQIIIEIVDDPEIKENIKVTISAMGDYKEHQEVVKDLLIILQSLADKKIEVKFSRERMSVA